MWSLLDAHAVSGIQLTESLAMLPASSVSALVFAAPHSAYFAVGQLQKDPVVDYAARKEAPLEEIERWLGPNLAYARGT